MELLNEDTKTLNLRRNGFVIAPEENFRDDGNFFRGYYYDPDKTGDKRIVAHKLIADGQAYVTAEYNDEVTGKTHYFDDLNGVDYQYAIDHIGDLTGKLNDFRGKLDRGEIKAKELTPEELEDIKTKAIQVADMTGDSYYTCLGKVLNKLGIDAYDLPSVVRNQLNKDVESAIRNNQQENPALVKAIAKKYLQTVLHSMRDNSGYGYKGKWISSPAKSLEDAMKTDVNVSTYSHDNEAADLIKAGLKADELYYLNKLTDATQARIKEWAKNKIETLYDFE